MLVHVNTAMASVRSQLDGEVECRWQRAGERRQLPQLTLLRDASESAADRPTDSDLLQFTLPQVVIPPRPVLPADNAVTAARADALERANIGFAAAALPTPCTVARLKAWLDATPASPSTALPAARLRTRSVEQWMFAHTRLLSRSGGGSDVDDGVDEEKCGETDVTAVDASVLEQVVSAYRRDVATVVEHLKTRCRGAIVVEVHGEDRAPFVGGM